MDLSEVRYVVGGPLRERTGGPAGQAWDDVGPLFVDGGRVPRRLRPHRKDPVDERLRIAVPDPLCAGLDRIQLLEPYLLADRRADRAHLRDRAEYLGPGKRVLPFGMTVLDKDRRGYCRDISLVGRLGYCAAVRPSDNPFVLDGRRPVQPV